jgi:hypothetical protein
VVIPAHTKARNASVLHDIYVVAGVLAMVTLAAALLLPAGLRSTHSDAAN